MAKRKQRIAGLVAIDRVLTSAGVSRRYLAERLDITEQSLAGWWIRNRIPMSRIGDIVEAIGIDPGDVAPELAAVFRAGWRRATPTQAARAGFSPRRQIRGD